MRCILGRLLLRWSQSAAGSLSNIKKKIHGQRIDDMQEMNKASVLYGTNNVIILFPRLYFNLRLLVLFGDRSSISFPGGRGNREQHGGIVLIETREVLTPRRMPSVCIVTPQSHRYRGEAVSRSPLCQGDAARLSPPRPALLIIIEVADTEVRWLSTRDFLLERTFNIKGPQLCSLLDVEILTAGKV